jgi:hypothetical protein
MERLTDCDWVSVVAVGDRGDDLQDTKKDTNEDGTWKDVRRREREREKANPRCCQWGW